MVALLITALTGPMLSLLRLPAAAARIPVIEAALAAQNAVDQAPHSRRSPTRARGGGLNQGPDSPLTLTRR